MADNEDNGDDVRRRSTFTPPPEGAEFPERLGELTDDDIAKAKQASEAASAATDQPSTDKPHVSQPSPEQASYFPVSPFDAPPSPEPLVTEPVSFEPPPVSEPRIPPAPSRTSLDDQQIMSQFAGGDVASTEALMNALESQLDLRAQEDQRFSEWEADIRALIPGEEAEALIRKSRREFDGLPPIPEPEGDSENVAQDIIETAPEADAPPNTGPGEAQWENPLLAEFARDTSEIPAPSPGEDENVAVRESEQPLGGFDTVLNDPDASSPPTASWPLVPDHSAPPLDVVDEGVEGSTEGELEVPAEEDPEPVAPVQADSEQEAGEEEIILPTLVHAGISVGTETVTIREVVATREIPEEPFVGVMVEKERWFSFDRTGIDPSPELNRTSKALQIFWTWWSVTVPLGGFMVGAWLTGLGLSFIQAIIVASVGVALGAIPLVVGTLQGARTGLPALVVSRLTFGTVANIVPAAVLVVIRLAVAAFFVWAGVWVVSGIYQEANLWQGERALLDVLVLTVAVILVGALALAGRHWVSLVLWVGGGLSLLAAAGGIVLTWDMVTRSALSGPGAGVSDIITGITFVSAVMMILWAHAAPDIGRFVTPGRGGSSAAAVGFAAVVPPLLLLGWGSLLGASDGVGSNILADPFDQILGAAPPWYPIPAVVLMSLPLFALSALALHSSSYAVMSLGFALPRYAAATIGVVVVAGIAFGVLLTLGNPSAYLVDAVWLVGVVVAAYVGAVVADWLTRRYHPDHKVLLHTSAGYPRVRVAPLVGFVVAIAAGWGFVVGQTAGFSWLGYLVRLIDSLGFVDLSAYQLGVFVALVLSGATTAFAGIRGGAVPQGYKVTP